MKTLGAFCLALVLLGTANAAAGDEPAALKTGSQSIGPQDVVPVLIDIVKDKEEDELVRANAAQGLVALGRLAVPSLIEILKGKDNDLRIRAVVILANMRPGEGQEAMPILVKALTNKKEDKDLRRQAALALAQIVATGR
jgi:HEAT repeat protein